MIGKQVSSSKDYISQIQIDESWISKNNNQQLIIDPELLMCMICYGIPLGQYSQCRNCGRIFCEKDFRQVCYKLDTCPNCKTSPFIKRTKPHIVYTSLFQNISFQCQLCYNKAQTNNININKNQQQPDFKIQKKSIQKNIKQQGKVVKKYKKNQLFTHINDLHKVKIVDYKVLCDFSVFFDKKTDPIIFDFYQNIQINSKFQQYENNNKKISPKLPYQLDNGDFIVIDLQSQLVTSPTIDKPGKLIKKISNAIQKETQYEVWQILLDYDFRYYSQYVQNLIQKNYKQFKQNKKKNQFTFDLKQQRYRILFNKMKQINTYTEYQRNIRKTVVCFK